MTTARTTLLEEPALRVATFAVRQMCSAGHSRSARKGALRNFPLRRKSRHAREPAGWHVLLKGKERESERVHLATTGGIVNIARLEAAVNFRREERRNDVNILVKS